MKVILKEDIENLGKVGDVVKVKDGFGRNYLIPRNLAAEATKKSVKQLDHEKRLIEDRLNKIKHDAQRLAVRLESHSCTIPCKVGETDKLFGSVGARDIAEALRREGFDINRRQVMLDEPLKSLGVYTVPIKLDQDVEAKLKVWLVRK